jgi:hypothetical protein
VREIFPWLSTCVECLTKAVNLIRFEVLNHRQSRNFLSVLRSECDVLVCCSEVHSFPQIKNSSSYDEITTKILKACSSHISLPLNYICNQSVYAGIFPDRLKISIVKPLYKKGDKSCVTNYRPISLLAAFSKVLEKVMYNRLSHYMRTNNILDPEQVGF